MTERIPTDADATDFDYLAASLEAEMQMNVAARYFSKSAFDFYIGQMRQLCQRTLGEEAGNSTTSENTDLLTKG